MHRLSPFFNPIINRNIVNVQNSAYRSKSQSFQIQFQGKSFLIIRFFCRAFFYTITATAILALITLSAICLNHLLRVLWICTWDNSLVFKQIYKIYFYLTMPNLKILHQIHPIRKMHFRSAIYVLC